MFLFSVWRGAKREGYKGLGKLTGKSNERSHGLVWHGTNQMTEMFRKAREKCQSIIFQPIKIYKQLICLKVTATSPRSRWTFWFSIKAPFLNKFEQFIDVSANWYGYFLLIFLALNHHMWYLFHSSFLVKLSIFKIMFFPQHQKVAFLTCLVACRDMANMTMTCSFKFCKFNRKKWNTRNLFIRVIM